jgi:predicted transcriptional regulator
MAHETTLIGDMMKRIDQIDTETGEILSQGCLVYVPRKKHLSYGRWFAMNQDVMAAFKQFKRVEDYRVLFALLERLDFENFINASQADIAKDLDIDRSNVNRAIKRLIAAEAILEGPKVGINRTYRLNPNFGWKGSVGNHKKAVSDQMRQRMDKAGIVGVVENGK